MSHETRAGGFSVAGAQRSVSSMEDRPQREPATPIRPTPFPVSQDPLRREPSCSHRSRTTGRFEATLTAYSLEPDYRRPLLQIPPRVRKRLFSRLAILYGRTLAQEYMPELERILQVHHAYKPQEIIDREKHLDPRERFSERDVILITYGDLLRGKEGSALTALARFCDSYLEGTINTLHILPFHPYSSDRGFAVVDFDSVDPNLGTWEDIANLEGRYQLMFDGVVNHVSSRSRWFEAFLNGDPYYGGFFTSYETPDALTPEQRRLIFRPRTSDVLTEYHTLRGPRYVWTTFSRDQVDLNYKNPDVLLRVIEILLLYVRRGVDLLRLDAVTYLWSEPGTRCVHLQQTHQIVKLFRDVLDLVAPGVALVTETNVPHRENVSYFGNGRDEAQMVYNFALPPLVLYTFCRGDAGFLTAWAAEVEYVSDTTTFLNFLDSHDGIGLMGVRDILPPGEIDFLVERARDHGGFVSYKTAEDGTEMPYEINLTWFSALNREDGDEDEAFQVRRFVASRVIALVLKGVPGIYLHSLLGSRNDIEAVLATRSNRDINRTVIDEAAIREALNDPLSKIARISREFGRLILIRTRRRAFHPCGGQRILSLRPEVFAVLRTSPEGDRKVLALTNVTDRGFSVEIPLAELGGKQDRWFDLVSGIEWMADRASGSLRVTLEPYGIVWLEPFREKGPGVQQHARKKSQISSLTSSR